MKSDQPALDFLILALLASLVLLATLTMFWKPAYEPGFYATLGAIITTFTGACGAKWGLTQVSKT